MLEVRSAYGYYGEAGGVTGENPPQTGVRMPYRDYKKKYCHTHGTVKGSYDPQTKTIEVLFSDDEIESKPNLGKRYDLWLYEFLFDGVEIHRAYEGITYETATIEFYAKNRENATRNAKAYARKHGYTFIREATSEDKQAYHRIRANR